VTETSESDPLAAFAGLMAGAREEGRGEPDPAPYGYTIDEKTGLERPKKAPGRPRRSPSLDDLKAQRDAAATSAEGPGEGRSDRPPAAPKGRASRRRAKASQEPKPAPPVPQYLRNEGGIARAVNKQYRKIGRLLIAFGVQDIGEAFIVCTQAIDEDDITVGDAWEQLARTNPRVRAWLLKFLAGGAVGQLAWAHMPILGAILMKDAIRKRIPIGNLLFAFTGDDDDRGDGEPPAPGPSFEGLKQEDVAQMMAFAQATAEQMMSRGGNGVPERGDAGS
jgi:hypothetical protein